ncbi:hypothetical protein ACSBR2_026970 [Camellia fascicularis]
MSLYLKAQTCYNRKNAKEWLHQSSANNSLMGYTPYDRLRTTLLSQEKEHVNRLLQPIKDSWKKKGVSLLSDGWSNPQ